MYANGNGRSARAIVTAARSLWRSDPAREIRGPWPAHVRILVVQPWFRVHGRVKVLDAVRPHLLRRCRPQALAGPVVALQQIARLALDKELGWSALDYGILAFTGIGLPPLEPAGRDLLWAAFQAPVFQQFRDETGRLLAAECEARHGLHIDTDAAVFHLSPSPHSELLVSPRSNPATPVALRRTGLSATISRRGCPCGRPGPLLLGLRTAPNVAAAALALSAPML